MIASSSRTSKENKKSSVPMAAIVGSMSPSTSDHICTVTGLKVGEPMNSETTSSSNEMTMANSRPDSTPDRISGNTIRRNTTQGEAPSGSAAFSNNTTTNCNDVKTVEST